MDASRIVMTEAGILEALRQALEKVDAPEDAFTTPQLAEIMGVSEAKVRKALQKMILAGDATGEYVWRTSVLTGRAVRVPAYRIIRSSDPSS